MLRWHRWDEMAFALQRWVDRITRQLRGPRPEPESQRRFIIIQIDGLAHSRLQLALAQGRMPFVRRLLQRGLVKESPFFCSLPSSTAAFQAGLFYGRIPDIPAWKYYDKRLRQVIYFPDPGAAALVEGRESAGCRGLLKGGTCYGAVFSGDAETSVASFSRIYRPRLGFNWETLWFFVPNIIALWVFIKILVLGTYELLYGLARSFIDLARWREERLSVRKVLYRTFFHVVWRELLTLGVSADIYHGVPRIFVNYLSYDVFAHKYGPSSHFALRSLKAIDASIRQIYRIARRVPEYNYDIFILSDHGMAEATSFEQISQVPLAEVLLGTLAEAQGEKSESRQPLAVEMVGDNDLAEKLTRPVGLREAASLLPPPLGKFGEKYLAKKERKRLQKLRFEPNLSKLLDEVKIVPSGPNVLIYFMYREEKVYVEEIEARYPGAIARLSLHPGIGLILARDARGHVFYWQGKQFRVDPSNVAPDCPFRNLTYRPQLMRAIAELMDMPSAGDLIIYGNGIGQGTISYLGERGSHAGLSADELFAFIIWPKSVDFSFERVTRPSDLYQFFSRYFEGEAEDRLRRQA